MSVPDSTLSDLAVDLFKDYRNYAVSPDVIQDNHRTIEEQLAALHFYDLKKDCPTVAGILLFGKNPRYFLPGAYIQYLVFPGTEITDLPIDQAEISGDLRTCIREIEIRLRANIRTRMAESGLLEHRTMPNYPEIALRELFLNAVMHRDYQSSTPVRLYFFSDHMEIRNPGGLYDGITLDTLEHQSGYRNPAIADALKTLDYVNKFGYGIQRAKAALKSNGNPPPVFDAVPPMFSVRLDAKVITT